MSKPDWCPQAVWDASIKALWTDAMHEGECPEWMETQVAIVARAILAATAAEREACALLAENFETTDILPFCGKVENECAQVGQEYAGDMLADAIRKRGEG